MGKLTNSTGEREVIKKKVIICFQQVVAATEEEHARMVSESEGRASLETRQSSVSSQGYLKRGSMTLPLAYQVVPTDVFGKNSF